MKDTIFACDSWGFIFVTTNTTVYFNNYMSFIEDAISI